MLTCSSNDAPSEPHLRCPGRPCAPPPLQGYDLLQTRGYAAKDLLFGDQCRAGVLAGVEKLADAVQVTLGPKVRSSYSWGADWGGAWAAAV